MRRIMATGGIIVVAIVSLACAPTPPPLPTPTAAPAAAAAPAAPTRTSTDGTIQSIEPTKVTLAAGQTFPLTGNTNVSRLVPITAGDLKHGEYVAVTAKRQPDNSLLASVINVFPTVGNTFQAPMAGGNLMTNAVIDQISGDSFTVAFTGGGAKVVPGPDVKISQFQVAALTDLKAGAAVTVVSVNGSAAAILLH